MDTYRCAMHTHTTGFETSFHIKLFSIHDTRALKSAPTLTFVHSATCKSWFRWHPKVPWPLGDPTPMQRTLTQKTISTDPLVPVESALPPKTALPDNSHLSSDDAVAEIYLQKKVHQKQYSRTQQRLQSSHQHRHHHSFYQNFNTFFALMAINTIILFSSFSSVFWVLLCFCLSRYTPFLHLAFIDFVSYFTLCFHTLTHNLRVLLNRPYPTVLYRPFCSTVCLPYVPKGL